MTGTPVPRSDEECARVARDSLKDLSATRAVRQEEAEGGSSFLSEAGGRSYRFVEGPGAIGPTSAGEHIILLSWGDLPLPFALVPRPDVTYFDVRFGAHSRKLDAVASELKACLERNGCVFRTFSPAPRARGRLGVLRRLLGR